MKKIIPLIFSVLYVISSNAQAVGGWGTCEFATIAAMNVFDPSSNAYDCKKVFVQATNEHYYWNGTIWVLAQGTDDQNASEVPFTPVGTIVATDVQAAIAEIEPDIYGSIDVHSDVDITTSAPSTGDLLSWDGSNFVPLATDNGYTVFNIFAEESAPLGAGQKEWAFGNGDNTPNGHGIVIPVDCELFAMSIDHEGGVNTTVRIIKNTDATLSTYQVSTTASENGYATFGTPLSFSAGDIANFSTISVSSTGTSGRASAWFRIRATPASTSLVNDMLDVSAGSIASGDVLYFDGSSFVPLTLEAGNIPYDNTISGLTASNVKAAIDELASGSGGGGSSSTGAFGTIFIDSGDEDETSLSEDTPVKADGTTTLVDANDVDMPANNRLRYTGTDTQTFFVSCNISKQADGNKKQYLYSIRKNGSDVPSILAAEHHVEGNSSNELNSTTITGTVELATNDYVELWVENIENGDDVTIWYMNMTIMSIGGGGGGSGRPDRKLDVEGGQVRFSDYGTGTYEDTTAVYLLGVEADGDIIEMNTAKNSRIFYPPSIAITANAITADLEINLHETYVDLFEGSDPSFIKSTNAPGAIPTYDEDELYYYILNYDTSIFANIDIDEDGLMTYDVIAVPTDNYSFINVVFVIKEP